MKNIHIECRPDEVLVRMLGFTRKSVTHHQGKSRVFAVLKNKSNELAVVDEDPGSVKSDYEKSLRLQDETEGIKYFIDSSGNKIFTLSGKLEDWIISVCHKEKVNLSDFGLPDRPEHLHDEINNKLTNFEKLLDALINNKCAGILKLKKWLE